MTAQTFSGNSGRIVQNYGSGPRGEHMLLIIGMLVTLTAVVIVFTVRVPGGVAAAPFGWMSEQWLAEHRASHPS